MWVREMTGEQKREYGFVKMTVSSMAKIGYKPVSGGWKVVERRGEVRVWQGGEIRIIRAQ
ncbi:hypothetical protein D3C74_268920 [compost metagenome]